MRSAAMRTTGFLRDVKLTLIHFIVCDSQRFSMPPRRSRSSSGTPAVKAPSKSISPAARASGRASVGSAAATPRAAPSTPRVSDEVQAIIDQALATARAARGLPTTGRLTPSNVVDDGEKDSAPERARITGGFFSHNDRVYSRNTTQCLTDFAGFLLLVFLAFYFSVSGYVFYLEFSK
jgi:hypothetical protein